MLVKKKPAETPAQWQKRTNALEIIIQKLTPFSSVIYLETENGNLPKRGVPLLKITDEKVFPKAIAALESLKKVKVTDLKDNKFSVQVGSDDELTEVNIYKSGGGFLNVIDEKGKALASKSPSTAQQEDGTRYCLEYYATNKEMPTEEMINKAIKFNFDKSWHDSFKKTINAILTVIPKSCMAQYDFYRDSNPQKPKFLNQITDSNVLPDSKDNWNPSDIWAVKRRCAPTLANSIDALYKKLLAKKAGIEHLNKFVEKKFNSKEIIGISLKKVEGTTEAGISKIKVDAEYSKSIKYCGPWKKFDYKVSNTYFDLLPRFEIFKDSVNYRFRFRPRGASNELNTYGEGQPETAKVFDGAISKDMLNRRVAGLDAVTSDMKESTEVKANVAAQIKSMGKIKIYEGFAKYFSPASIKANKFKFVSVSGITDEMSEYEVKRAVVLLYYIYALETASNPGELYKRMYLAAKKMNAFSSVHYKILSQGR